MSIKLLTASLWAFLQHPSKCNMNQPSWLQSSDNQVVGGGGGRYGSFGPVCKVLSVSVDMSLLRLSPFVWHLQIGQRSCCSTSESIPYCQLLSVLHCHYTKVSNGEKLWLSKGGELVSLYGSSKRWLWTDNFGIYFSRAFREWFVISLHL